MNKKSGYIYLGIMLILEGLFPIFTYFALQSVPTLWLVAFSIGISLFFLLIIFFKDKLYKGYSDKEILFPTAMSAIFLGVGGLLYFFGIKYSSPSIAAILLLVQSFFAFIIFNIFGKESYHFKQILGAIIMFIGGVLVLYEGDNFISLGAAIMILAALIFSIGNYYTKQASLKGASPYFLLVNRNFLMIMVTSLLAYTNYGFPDILIIKQSFIWIFLIGFLVLFLSKILWVKALSRLDSFVAISSFPIIPLVVLILSFFILGEVPSLMKLLGFIPIILGSLLLVKKK